MMIRCVLTDIEGTTSSIEFVHKVLFPYARANFHDFLSSTSDQDVSDLILKVWTEDLGHDKSTSIDLKSVTALLQKWIDQDLKHPVLKALQGKIWREGYESKAYRGHVYPEVKEALALWQSKGLSLAVYSSGSVAAQKLLFKNSEAGDLTPYFSSYFDTEVGHKRESKSYQTIAKRLDLAPNTILFLSDIKEELDAAKEAGMKTCQLLREPLPAQGEHPKAHDFLEVEAIINT